jgi:hypothetical protein
MGEEGGAILAATVRDLTSKMRTNPMKKRRIIVSGQKQAINSKY